MTWKTLALFSLLSPAAVHAFTLTARIAGATASSSITEGDARLLARSADRYIYIYPGAPVATTAARWLLNWRGQRVAVRGARALGKL